MQKNLWKVTVEVLGQHGKTWADVQQVQASGEKYPLGAVETAMKATLFHDAALGDEVAVDLVVVGAGWAMRWDRGWVWMEIPALLPESAEAACPAVFSTADETDDDGCRVPTYNKKAKEIKPKKNK